MALRRHHSRRDRCREGGRPHGAGRLSDRRLSDAGQLRAQPHGGRRLLRRGGNRRAVQRPDGRRHHDSARQLCRAGRRRDAAVDHRRRCGLSQPRPAAPLVLMSYLNPLLSFGIATPAARGSGRRRQRLHRAGPAFRGERRAEARARGRGTGADADGDAGDAARAARAAVPRGQGLYLCRDHDRHHRQERRRCRTRCSPTWTVSARLVPRAGVRRVRHSLARAGARAWPRTSMAWSWARPWSRCWSEGARRDDVPGVAACEARVSRADRCCRWRTRATF